MIVQQDRVEQAINRELRGRFVKEVCVARVRGSEGDIPLSMVRKRLEGRDGTRASVLLVHGYGQNRYAWHLPSRSLANYFAASNLDVYNLDLRGHGRSRRLGARVPRDVSEFVREDIPAAVEEIQRLSGPRPVFLLGHSLGGLVSYAAAPGLGDAVAGVISLGSPYHFTRGSWALSLMGHLLLAVDRRVSFGHGSLMLKSCGDALRRLRIFMDSPLPLPIRGFLPGSMEREVLGEHLSLAMDCGSVTVLRNMFLAAAEARQGGHGLGGLSGFAEPFEAMDRPLLVIAGAADDLAPPASVEPGYARSRSRDKTYRVFTQGHIDLLMGRGSTETIWPLIDQWIDQRAA
jgi:polyhydroxyalkanoate synthase subunit PhaC